MNKIIIFGGTGYIGRNLVRLLSVQYKIIVVTRSSPNTYGLFDNNIEIFEWNYEDANPITTLISDSYAIINLTGENISSKRWTKKQKDKIVKSRINTTSKIVNVVKQCEHKPKVFIQGSAIGYHRFGCKDDIPENNGNTNTRGFLAEVVKNWERQVDELDKKQIRIIVIRTGIVIGKQTSIIKRLRTTFNMYFGGHFGNGKQWFSWIHIEDQVNAIRFLLENKSTSGKYNLTAPAPVSMKNFCISFGNILNRPSWLHIPGFILKIFFGQMAEEILLNGNKILPARLQQEGYKFKYPELNSALNQIITE